MTRDANDVAREYARQHNHQQEQAQEAPRKGRVLGVFTHHDGDFVHGHQEGEDLIAEHATMRIISPDTAMVETEFYSYLVNLRAYRYVEFWADPVDGEG